MATRRKLTTTDRKRAHNNAVNMAVKLADTELGMSGGSTVRGARSTPFLDPNQAGMMPKGIDPKQDSGWAPFKPVPQPTPHEFKPVQPTTPETGTASWGASGTPITSGYLLDLGEYNPQTYGRDAIQLWEKMRRGDGQIWATLRAAKQPQFSATWEIVPGVKPSDPGYAKAKEVADFVRENLFGGLEFQNSLGGTESQTFDDVLYNLLLALDFGCAVHEDIWAVDGKTIRLRKLAGRQALTFYRWHTEGDGETLIGLEQYGYRGAEFVNCTVPSNKLCRLTLNQEGANFWGISLLRPIYPHWYIVNSLYRVDAIAGERSGMGVPVITLNEGFSSQDRASALGFVTQLAAHELTGLVLAPNQTFKLHGVEGQTHDLLASIEHHKRQMSFAALQHFLTIGTAPNGSRATAQTQHGFFIAASKYLATQAGNAVRNSTVRRLVRFNFGEDADVPLVLPKNIKAEDFQVMLDKINASVTAGTIVSDKGLRDFARERLDLPEETDEGVIAIKGEAVSTGMIPKGDSVSKDGITAPNANTPPQPGSNKNQAKAGEIEGQGIMSARVGRARMNLGGTGKSFSFSSIGKKADREFSSVQANLPGSIAGKVLQLGRELIARDDLAEKGFENNPHITVKYGLHGNDPSSLTSLMNSQPSITVTLGKTSVFNGVDEGTADAVKVDVISPKLHALNGMISDSIEHTDTTLDYIPHVTLAYVKPGMGEKYVGDATLFGTQCVLSELTFTGKDRIETPIPLTLSDGFLPDTTVPDTMFPDTIEAGDDGRAMTMKMSDKGKKKVVPKHFDLAAAVGSTKKSAHEILKILSGGEHTKLIQSVARQAVTQLQRGVPVSQLQFSMPTHLDHKLETAIGKLRMSAKEQAVSEIRRALK